MRTFFKVTFNLLSAFLLIAILNSESSAQGTGFVKAVRAFEDQILRRECVDCNKVFDRRHCGECETSAQDLGVYTPIEKDDSTFNDTASIVIPFEFDVTVINPLDIRYSQSRSLANLYDQIDSEIDKLQKLQKRILNMNQFLQLMIAKDVSREIPIHPGVKPVEEKPFK